jgi:phage gp29-like protein
VTRRYFNNAETIRQTAPAGVFLSQLGIKAAISPALPMQVGTGQVSTTGVLFPTLGIDELAAQDRVIRNDPRESYFWTLPNKLTPQQCLQMLRAALAGDLFQQFNLAQLMLDTWPTFRMASHQLMESAAYMRYAVHPCAEEGKKPTKSALEKADLVSRAIRSMAPNPFNDEKGFSGMAYQLCDAMLNGLSLVELMWQMSNREWLPVSAAWVHPRHYTFDVKGNIALYNDDGERISPGSNGSRQGFMPDPDKFVCAQFMSRAGSPLGAGFMRPLVWYWAARQFNNEWMLNTAKQYGSPFIDITYKPGTVTTGPGGELEKLNEMLKTAGAQRRLIHPEGTTAEIHQPSSLGKENPQRVLEEKADEACLFLLLGQKGTTTAVSGQLGNDDSHENVKEERKLGLANWLARNPLRHFARAILRRNYGNCDECPEVLPDTTKPLKPEQVGAMMSSVTSSRIPIRADELYKKIGFTKPDVGEEVIVGGELMLQEEAMTKEDKFNEQLEQQVKQGEASLALQEEAQGGNPAAQASAQPVKINVIRALAAATPEELAAIETKLLAAETAPHKNGEAAELLEVVNRVTKRF